MSKSKKKRKQRAAETNQQSSGVAFFLSDIGNYDLMCTGYTTLDKNPEIYTACRTIARLISSMTIRLMANTESGDVRIENELSRKIDINPNQYMTRRTFIEYVTMNMLLYGQGNSVVRAHTQNGLLQDLEPIQSNRVSFYPDGYGYKVTIDGTEYAPDELLHFVDNPDPYYPWKGRGIQVVVKDVANNLKQAQKTKNSFMTSQWKPSVIVKVDALTDEFSSPEGRKKLLKEYVQSSEIGEPWLIPADQFSVEQIKPLSLSDLAISDSVEMDKKTVAAIVGVPPFVLGVGDYNKQAWNSFVQNTVKPIAQGIEEEMTRKLIVNPKWYLKFNILSLMDWDIKTIADVFGALSDRGFVDGNEVRDRIGMDPRDGLDELRVLENYIPFDMSALQKKLIQEEEA